MSKLVPSSLFSLAHNTGGGGFADEMRPPPKRVQPMLLAVGSHSYKQAHACRRMMQLLVASCPVPCYVSGQWPSTGRRGSFQTSAAVQSPPLLSLSRRVPYGVGVKLLGSCYPPDEPVLEVVHV